MLREQRTSQHWLTLVTKRACQRKVYERFISRIMKDGNVKWEVNLHDGTGPNILKEFLFLVLRTPVITYQLERLGSGSEYPEVSQKVDLPKIKIPKPDKARQQEIIDKVKPVLEEVKLLRSNSNKKLNEARKIFDELILKVHA